MFLSVFSRILFKNCLEIYLVVWNLCMAALTALFFILYGHLGMVTWQTMNDISFSSRRLFCLCGVHVKKKILSLWVFFKTRCAMYVMSIFTSLKLKHEKLAKYICTTFVYILLTLTIVNVSKMYETFYSALQYLHKKYRTNFVSMNDFHHFRNVNEHTK